MHATPKLTRAILAACRRVGGRTIDYADYGIRECTAAAPDDAGANMLWWRPSDAEWESDVCDHYCPDSCGGQGIAGREGFVALDCYCFGTDYRGDEGLICNVYLLIDASGRVIAETGDSEGYHDVFNSALRGLGVALTVPHYAEIFLQG